MLWLKVHRKLVMQCEIADFDLTIILSDDNTITIDLTPKIINLKPAHYIIALCNTMSHSVVEMVKNG
jgi:hypothetical protein